MTLRNYFVQLLTPSNTEEVKPGVFIKRRNLLGKDSYSQVSPACWDGKFNWKNIIIGPHFWKNFIYFAIIMFLMFAYWHDTHAMVDNLNEIYEDPYKWCADLSSKEIVTIDYDNALLSLEGLINGTKEGETQTGKEDSIIT